MLRLMSAAMVAIFAASPADACHRFSVWKYPTPQRCSVTSPQVDKTWFVQLVLPEEKPPVKTKPPVIPPFVVSKYNTIILHLPPGTPDEEGRADAIELLKQVMGQ